MRARFSADLDNLSISSAKWFSRFQPGREIVVGLLQICRIIGETNIADTNLHAGDRRLRLHRIPRDRLLPGHARIEIARRRVGPDLDNHHRGDEQNAEARGDAELGADERFRRRRVMLDMDSVLETTGSMKSLRCRLFPAQRDQD